MQTMDGQSRRFRRSLLIAAEHFHREAGTYRLLDWMIRQPWIIRSGEWADEHVPSWFTLWNVVYVGFGLYALLVLVMVLTH